MLPGTARGVEALEEVIVTAQKRQEPMQKVAIAVTVFSGQDLQQLGIREPIDLAMQTPGLLTTVGRPRKPCVVGKGGRWRGSPRLPSRDSSSADSSPQMYAPAPR